MNLIILKTFLKANMNISSEDESDYFSESEDQETHIINCTNYKDLIKSSFISYYEVFKSYCENVYFVEIVKEEFAAEHKNNTCNYFYHSISSEKDNLKINYVGKKSAMELFISEGIYLGIPTFNESENPVFVFFADRFQYKKDFRGLGDNHLYNKIIKSSSFRFTVYLLCIGGQTTISCEKKKINWNLKKENCYILGINFIKNESIESFIEDLNDEKARFNPILPYTLSKLLKSGKIKFFNFEYLRLIEDCEIDQISKSLGNDFSKKVRRSSFHRKNEFEKFFNSRLKFTLKKTCTRNESMSFLKLSLVSPLIFRDEEYCYLHSRHINLLF